MRIYRKAAGNGNVQELVLSLTIGSRPARLNEQHKSYDSFFLYLLIPRKNMTEFKLRYITISQNFGSLKVTF